MATEEELDHALPDLMHGGMTLYRHMSFLNSLTLGFPMVPTVVKL